MILISNQEKGYFITATINHGSYIPEALHVERIDDMALYDGDFEAAKAAEQDFPPGAAHISKTTSPSSTGSTFAGVIADGS